jgi:hypothetical protein
VRNRVAVPQLNDPGGFGLSSSVLEAMSVVGIRQTGWRWRYNPSVPRPTGAFGPHLDLAGASLQELPSDEGWYPGDHQGCRCAAVPVLRGPDGRFVRAGVTEADDVLP